MAGAIIPWGLAGRDQGPRLALTVIGIEAGAVVGRLPGLRELKITWRGGNVPGTTLG